MGRRRKFRNNDIVLFDNLRRVVVDYYQDLNRGHYWVIPIDAAGRRYGPARRIPSHQLQGTEERSTLPNVKVYRANRKLDEELGGRGCDCHCCPHSSLSMELLTTHGEWRDGQTEVDGGDS